MEHNFLKINQQIFCVFSAEVLSELRAGYNLTVTWHLGYPHRVSWVLPIPTRYFWAASSMVLRLPSRSK